MTVPLKWLGLASTTISLHEATLEGPSWLTSAARDTHLNLMPLSCQPRRPVRRAWGAPLRRCVVALVGRPGATSPEEIIGIHDSIGTSNFGSIPSGGFLIAGICDPILRMTRKSSHWGRQWVCHLAPKSPMRVAPRHKHKGRERSWAAGGGSGDGGAARAARCEQKKGMAGSWISVAYTQSQRARAPRCHRQTSPGRPSPWCFRVVVYPEKLPFPSPDWHRAPSIEHRASSPVWAHVWPLFAKCQRKRLGRA